MFKILVTTKFRDRVVNYAQTAREHVGTMREDACQCLTVCAMPRLSRIATDSSRTAHVEFTSSSRAVHEKFRSISRLMRDSGARGGAWVYTGLPGHCSPFRRSPARRQLISQRQHAATTNQTKWHDLPRQNRGTKSCKCQPCITNIDNTYVVLFYIKKTSNEDGRIDFCGTPSRIFLLHGNNMHVFFPSVIVYFALLVDLNMDISEEICVAYYIKRNK